MPTRPVKPTHVARTPNDRTEGLVDGIDAASVLKDFFVDVLAAVLSTTWHCVVLSTWHGRGGGAAIHRQRKTVANEPRYILL